MLYNIVMWSYYGRKTKVVKYYPAPEYDTIIEPFAGTATYSMHRNNWQKNVILIEKYDVLIRIWKYLQRANKQDIMSMIDVAPSASIVDMPFSCEEQKWLVGYMINGGSASPKLSRSSVGNFGGDFSANKKRIADNLKKIRQWDIRLGDYHESPDIEATWFIDPPYQYGGEYYRYGNKDIDYAELAEWCRSRRGQVIVCENSKADWLPFTPLANMRGNLHRTTESVWYNNVQQTSMF